jgi:uncharacterized glyoxalase superfamily protein PhnB
MLDKLVATVLFVKDLAGCTAFYRDILELKMQESDPVSAGFSLGNHYLILLDISSAANLIGSEVEDLRLKGGARTLLAAEVQDIDAIHEKLKNKGVTFLKPPINQPWGLRTAHFTDPEGNIWEINQPVSSGTTE